MPWPVCSPPRYNYAAIPAAYCRHCRRREVEIQVRASVRRRAPLVMDLVSDRRQGFRSNRAHGSAAHVQLGHADQEKNAAGGFRTHVLEERLKRDNRIEEDEKHSL